MHIPKNKLLKMKKLFLALFIFTPVLCYSQEYNVENLVFEGAGIRGIAYAGVLQQLDSMGILKNVKKVGGTSAGAITALCISLGYDYNEIEKIISETDFQDFNQGSFLFGPRRFVKNFGWFKNREFQKWLSKLVKNKGFDADITLKELHETGNIDLYLTSTSLNNQKLLILSYLTYPNMKVVDAVTASMSIPLYFEPLYIDSVGNVYNKKNAPKEHDLLLDGGFIANFPIFIFDSIYYEKGQAIRIENPKTLGIRIDTDEQILYDNENKGLAPMEINNITDYVQAFYVFTLENLNRSFLTEKDWQRTISVSSVGIGPKVKKLSEKQKKDLINSGSKATKKYFENHSVNILN